MAGKSIMTLFPLINQKKNLDYLRNIIKNERVGNAYLFYGPEGSGSEGFALEFAAMLNCGSESESPCGSCHSCKKMHCLEHANLEMVYPIPIRKDQGSDSDPFKKFTNAEIEEIQEIIQKKAQNPYSKIIIPKAKHIPINFIREIKRKTYLRSQESGWKVIVIFDAHLLTEPAANAFLKILEEPPEKSTFILSTSNINAILPTISSRCQPLFFPALAPSHLRDYLLTKNVPEDHIKLIIRLSAGDVNQAINLLDADIETFESMTLEIMRAVAVWNVKNIYNYVESLTALYREDSTQFNQVLLSVSFWFRDAILLKTQTDPEELVHSNLQEEIAKFVNAFPEFDPYFALSSVENCIDFINRNVYINVALLNLFFNLFQSLNSRKIL
ncbi:MAG: DNA polymerase III subunit delta' [Candidatus Marinimicrobia bacterium]|nr:DNA polymerase III subunit delta' [Candidatus Neomarinimicrobiota bacterium]